MQDRRWTFDDLTEGLVLDLGTKQVTAEEIIEFAAEFDPQPFHLDAEAGASSILGGLAASGWHTCCIFMRMFCDAFLLDSTAQGTLGMDAVRWKAPVLAGDTLSGRSEVLSRRLSRSRPGIGLVTFHTTLANQRGDVLAELENVGMFLTREAAA